MNQVLIVQNQERVNREWMSDQATSRPRYQNAGVLNTEIINSEWEAMSEDPKNISFDDVAYTILLVEVTGVFKRLMAGLHFFLTTINEVTLGLFSCCLC